MAQFCRSSPRPLVPAATLLLAMFAWPGHAVLAQSDSGKVKIEIEGLKGDLNDNVHAVMQLAREAKKSKLPPDRVERLYHKADADINTALQPFGFYRPRITKSLERDGNDWVARFTIDPGPVVRVRNVNITVTGEGDSDRIFKRTIRRFPLQKGDTLRHALYQLGKLSLLNVASDSGYLKASYDTSVVMVDRKADTADVLMRFDTGPRAHFGPVRFHEERDILDTTFLATRISFKRGELFRHDKLLDLQTSLSEDPYWTRVEVMPKPDEMQDSTHEVPIDIDLIPNARHSNEFGIGYGTDTGPRGHAQSLWRYLNRKGHNAEATLSVGSIQQSITATYKIPAFGTPTGVLTFEAGYQRSNPKTSISHAGKFRPSLLRKRLGWQETLSLTYLHETYGVGVDSGTSNLFMPGGSWTRTVADSKTYPLHGYKSQFDVQGSERGVLANASFLQVHELSKGIWSFSRRLRILGRVELGHTFTNQFRSLPATLRFFTGGDETVRGFSYQALGELDEKGNVIGGPSLVVASLESDYRIFSKYGVAVFTDAGNAMQSIRFNHLEHSVGAGLRWLSPVGTIRLDGAFAVSRPGSPFRLHVSIGADL